MFVLERFSFPLLSALEHSGSIARGSLFFGDSRDREEFATVFFRVLKHVLGQLC